MSVNLSAASIASSESTHTTTLPTPSLMAIGVFDPAEPYDFCFTYTGSQSVKTALSLRTLKPMKLCMTELCHDEASAHLTCRKPTSQ